MVITNIIGGLGNQMFQYAAGRALSLNKGVSLRLDISDFSDYELHQGFELDSVFACQAMLVSKKEMWDVLGWQSLMFAKRVLSKPWMAGFRQCNFLVEPHFHYWPALQDASTASYLKGYWQSEKYFKSHEAVIREDFVFNGELSEKNLVIADSVTSTNAVSLHVRRGDYVSNPTTNANHGLCSIDYYQSAVGYIASRISEPYFYVFSDDIAWVKNNLRINFPCSYIDHNQGKESYNDMRLMSMCQHHVIANSSFSWWGAWLNPDPKKIVIAPNKWFSSNHQTNDLIPQEWVRL